MAMRLVILDRDGVINHDSSEYIKTPDEWLPIPGSLEAIARLNHADYRIIIATNQSGLARGLYDMDALARIHQKMNYLLNEVGGFIDAVFFCPHGPDANCRCRKPAPGLFDDIAARLKIDLQNVPAIGDSLRDIQAAQAVGARPILVRTGNGEEAMLSGKLPKNVPIYADLSAAVDALLQEPTP